MLNIFRYKILNFIHGLIYGYVSEEELASIRKSMHVIEEETPYGTLTYIKHPLLTRVEIKVEN